MLLRPLQDEMNGQDNRHDHQPNEEGWIILKTMTILDKVKKKGDIVIIMVGVSYRLPPERYRKSSHAFAGHTPADEEDGNPLLLRYGVGTSNGFYAEGTDDGTKKIGG